MLSKPARIDEHQPALLHVSSSVLFSEIPDATCVSFKILAPFPVQMVNPVF